MDVLNRNKPITLRIPMPTIHHRHTQLWKPNCFRLVPW